MAGSGKSWAVGSALAVLLCNLAEARPLRSLTSADEALMETAEENTVTLPWCRKTAAFSALHSNGGLGPATQAYLFSGKAHDKVARKHGSTLVNDLWTLELRMDDEGHPKKGGYRWHQVDQGDQAAVRPDGRWKSSADFLEGNYYAFGGDNGDVFKNDLWVLPVSQVENASRQHVQWTPVTLSPSAPLPKARRGHTLIGMPQSRSLVLIGGRAKGHLCLADAWFLKVPADGAGWGDSKWKELPPLDGDCRWGHTGTLAKDPVTGRDLVVVFGGRFKDAQGNFVYLNDLWLLSLDVDGDGVWTRVEYKKNAAVPHPRDHHTVVFDSSSSSLYLFGGRITEETMPALNDLWRFSLNTMSWEELQPKGFLPATRYVHSAVMMNGLMVVFGGEHFKKDQSVKKDHKLNDLWAYSPKQNRWTEVAPKNCKANSDPEEAEAKTSNTLMLVLLTAVVLSALMILGNVLQSRHGTGAFVYCLPEPGKPRQMVQLTPFRRGYEPIKETSGE